MEKNNYPEPPRSACVFCPFHSDAEWKTIKDNDPEGFRAAVDLEKSIVTSKSQCTGRYEFKGDIRLHRSMQPLDEIDFDDISQPQLDLWGNECEGMCGV
tara:strand:- start:790 stop:1086 length:297 start_codon:yes stop_codon:yes gene_type:complete